VEQDHGEVKQRRRLRHAAEQHARGPESDGAKQGEAAVPDGPRHVLRHLEEAFAQRDAIVDRIESSR
jgi:hypothetical protein